MPPICLTHRTYTVHLREPFRISRGTQTIAQPVIVTLTADGFSGIGEAAPSSFYGETTATVLAAIEHFGTQFNYVLGDIQSFHDYLNNTLRFHPAAKSAMISAAYDLFGKSIGQPVYRLLGLDPQRTPLTSFTIGISEPEEMARKAREAQPYPVLKVKVGTNDDVARLTAIRHARPEAIIRVDANGAWTPRQAITMLERLQPFNIQFVEQPVAAHDIAGLAWVRDHASLPIFADESCVTARDVPRVANAVDGIVVKLAKTGGIVGALEQITAARLAGKQIMLGCMIETSVGITAAAHLSPLVDYADLDGNLLNLDDPFTGVTVKEGKLILPERPGLGIGPRESDAG